MPWARNPNVIAILAARFPGEQSGIQLWMFSGGVVEPSERLAFTIPEKEDHGFLVLNLTGVTDPNAWQENFTE